MIFLIAAAALCMGGIVAYLAREKGRNPLTWAIYGTVAAPIALPHILIVRPLHDADGDVWAEIRDAIQTQSVNDQHPIMARSGEARAGTQPRREPQAMPRREAPLRQAPAPSVARAAAPADLNPAPKPDIKPDARFDARPEPRREPTPDMSADKRTPSSPAQRAEPSFGPTSTIGATADHAARAASNEFMLNASDRIGAPHTAQAAAPGFDMRTRAPLSIDPNADRAESRPIVGRLFAFGAVAVAIAAGFFVLGPTLAKLVPPELAFWAKPAVTEVKNTAPALTPFDALPNGTSSATPGAAPNDALPGGLPGGNVSGAKEVGEAKFGGPIKSDTKAPAYTGSGAAPVDLGQATRGMKPVDVPEETKSEPKAAPQAAPKAPAKSEAQKNESRAAAVTPAPTPAPKAEPKAVAATPAPAPAPKVEAPKPAPQATAPKPAAPPEDFLSMVNKAITPGSTASGSAASRTAPAQQTATRGDDQAEQVSAANDLVQSVQVKLREKGFDPGSIDGRTNPKTVQAVRDYQQSIGMTPDGLIDVALMERLGVVGKRLQFPGAR